MDCIRGFASFAGSWRYGSRLGHIARTRKQPDTFCFTLLMRSMTRNPFRHGPTSMRLLKGKPAAHLRKHQEWHLEDKDWSWWQNVVSKYYGDVSLIDDCVGRVLDAIQECGIEDDTIFVFSTDHGDATGSHKHFEKSGTMYDEVFRIPRFLRKCPVRLPDRHQSLFALWI